MKTNDSPGDACGDTPGTPPVDRDDRDRDARDHTPGSAAMIAATDVVIRGRRTAKLLADPVGANFAPLSDADRGTLDGMIELAGHAPFHRRADESHRGGTLDSIVPWRFHVLERDACGRLVEELRARAAADGADPRWNRAANSKIPALLAAAGALVQVTWLPNPARGNAAGADAAGADAAGAGAAGANATSGDLLDDDVEHVAAASAAVQNLLLAAEANGWYGYWSSGGILRGPELFERLGIAPEERPLGSIFLTPPDGAFDRNVPGGLRESRGKPSSWSRRVTLD